TASRPAPYAPPNPQSGGGPCGLGKPWRQPPPPHLLPKEGAMPKPDVKVTATYCSFRAKNAHIRVRRTGTVRGTHEKPRIVVADRIEIHIDGEEVISLSVEHARDVAAALVEAAKAQSTPVS